ncbi:MAG: ABC transporter permease, partial [bacterium]|nr:ABC transporter permease [bacterium]
MFKNYLQIAYRNIRKNPGISFLNITGFAVGIAFSGLLFLWIFDELSYDSYHEKADQIYRIYSCVGEEPSILSPPALAPAMKAAYPEVLAATRIFDSWGTARVEYGEKAFIEPELYFSDSTIFEVLTLPIIKGNEKNALNKPNTAIITGSIAEKYFGDAEPIDKVLQVNGKPYRVTAIVKEAPNNSHFHYDLICNDGSNDSKWYSYMYTYVLLPKGYHKSKMESKLDKLVEEIIGPQMKDLKGISHEEYISSGKKWEYRLQQITDIHLNSGLLYELEPGGNLNYVYVLFCSGILIFIAACLNYISIATASSIKRAKEVSLRKVFGS